MNKELLDKAIKCLAITDVYLHNVHAVIHEGFDPKEPSQSLAVQFRFTPKRYDLVDAKQEAEKFQLLRVYLDAGLRVVPSDLQEEVLSDPEQITKHVRAEILAEFVAEYLVTSDDLPKKAVEEFVKNNAGFHVWPYWRELAQSMGARMHLPDLVMPMYRLGIDQQDNGKSEKPKTPEPKS